MSRGGADTSPGGRVLQGKNEPKTRHDERSKRTPRDLRGCCVRGGGRRSSGWAREDSQPLKRTHFLTEIKTFRKLQCHLQEKLPERSRAEFPSDYVSNDDTEHIYRVFTAGVIPSTTLALTHKTHRPPREAGPVDSPEV